jgi:peptidoglycan/LPS O-acetylase OafA/YrhL/glycosyltransferase involved in cell wall biosynthesis
MVSQTLLLGTDAAREPAASCATRTVASSAARQHGEYLNRKYVPELDGLRAWSILLVIGAHMPDHASWDWLGGRLGVTVFFVLSGYLITALALREEMQRGALCLRAFYVRRCFRIFPVYYLVVALHCFYILALGIHPETKPLLWDALPYLCLYLQEVPFFFGLHGVHAGIPFFQSWSLGVEEKFYLVWPLLAFVFWRRLLSPRILGTVVLLAALAVTPVLGIGEVANCLYPHYLILVGCLVALLLNDPAWFRRLRFLGTRPWPYVAAAAFLALHFAKPHLPEFYWHFGDPLYAICIGVFLASLLLGDSLVGRFLRLGPLVFAGKVSYGIYLIHVLCLGLASRFLPDTAGRVELNLLLYLATCALSVCGAYVLALLVERPLIDLGRRWSARIMRGANQSGGGASAAGDACRQGFLKGEIEMRLAPHLRDAKARGMAVKPRAEAGPRTLAFLCTTSAMAGAEHNLIRLASKLDPGRWRSVVVCPTEGALPAACRERGIDVRVVPHLPFFSTSLRLGTKWRVPNPAACAWDLGVLLARARRLSRLLREIRPDLVVTKGMFAHLYGGMAARQAGVPCLWHVEDWVSERWGGLFRRVFGRLAQWLPTGIVGCADPIAKQAPEMVRHKLRIIYNGVDASHFRPGADGAAVRRELKIPPDALVIGHVARMTPWKGQRYLLEAFSRLAGQNPRAHLLFVGSALFEGDAFEQSLRQRAAVLGLQDRVLFLGYRKDVRELLAAMDVFAYSSIEKETGPLSVLEAMATGLPVVGFDIPGVRLFVSKPECGLLVPVEDIGLLSDALSRVLGDETLRTSLAHGARSHVLSDFSMERHVARFEEAFLDVIMGTNERAA